MNIQHNERTAAEKGPMSLMCSRGAQVYKQGVMKSKVALIDSLYFLQQNNLFCDTLLVTREGDMLGAHASVLAAASPFLCLQLASCEPGSYKIRTGISLRLLELVLRHIYAADLTTNQLKELIPVLDQFGILYDMNSDQDVIELMEIPGEGDESCQILKRMTGREPLSEVLSPDIFLTDLPPAEIINILPKQQSQHMSNNKQSPSSVEETSSFINQESDLQITNDFIIEKELSEIKNGTGDQLCGQLFSCGICSSTFPDISELTEHEVKFHSFEKSEFVCRHCNRVYTDYKLWKRHERTHTRASDYQCKYCERSFSFPSNLKEHERTHTGDKPYKCDVCGKGYVTPSVLAVHTRSHTGEKPYSCRFCDKTFSASSGKRVHERMHTGERPYECKWCQFKFAQKSQLNSHVKKHTGERPYKCNSCDDAFRTSSARTKHQAKHKGKSGFKWECDICGSRFAKKWELGIHTVETHSDSMEGLPSVDPPLYVAD